MIEKRAWTARGDVPDATDKLVMQKLAAEDNFAARILITGEVSEYYVGGGAQRFLFNANDVYYDNGAGREPLFTETREGHIRMTRFDPKVTWRCVDPEKLAELLKDEAYRLSVELDPYKFDHFDFYEEMAHRLEERFPCMVPEITPEGGVDGFQNAVYLSALLLFRKPGYLDVPVGQWFAQDSVAEWMGELEFRSLSPAEIDRWHELKKSYGNIQALTNYELRFLVDLHERKV